MESRVSAIRSKVCCFYLAYLKYIALLLISANVCVVCVCECCLFRHVKNIELWWIETLICDRNVYVRIEIKEYNRMGFVGCTADILIVWMIEWSGEWVNQCIGMCVFVVFVLLILSYQIECSWNISHLSADDEYLTRSFSYCTLSCKRIQKNIIEHERGDTDVKIEFLPQM